MNASKTEFAKKDGRITDRAECVDYTERRQYAELAAKLHNLHPDREEAINGRSDTNIILHLSNEVLTHE